MVKKKPKGWRGQSRRHSLAALRGHRRKKLGGRKKTVRRKPVKRKRTRRKR